MPPARIGNTELISGPGPIGLLCLKLVLAERAKTIVAGAAGDRTRLDCARRIGAVRLVNVQEERLIDAVQEETGGEGGHVALEHAGHPDSVRGCLEALRPMGCYTQITICGRGISLPIDLIFYKQLTLSGSVYRTSGTGDGMMEMFAQGEVRLGDLVSAKLPLSEARRV